MSFVWFAVAYCFMCSELTFCMKPGTVYTVIAASAHEARNNTMRSDVLRCKLVVDTSYIWVKLYGYERQDHDIKTMRTPG